MSNTVSDPVIADRVNDDDDRRVTIHTYPGSGSRGGAKVGEKALCGWIKCNPRNYDEYPRHLWDRCVVCGELTGRWL